MRNFNIDKMGTLSSEMGHMFIESNTAPTTDVDCNSAVGCIISGSCRLRQEGALRIIPERMLYVIDNRTQSIEKCANHEGTFEQILFRIDSATTHDSLPSHRERERFNNAILQGIVSNLTIEELAAMCCYSVSTFKRRFSQHYHQSPHKWLLRCRLMLAAKIMSMTNISITEVSSLCGFVNVSHFIATFRRHFGITPSSLRNTSREQ